MRKTSSQARRRNTFEARCSGLIILVSLLLTGLGAASCSPGTSLPATATPTLPTQTSTPDPTAPIPTVTATTRAPYRSPTPSPSPTSRFRSTSIAKNCLELRAKTPLNQLLPDGIMLIDDDDSDNEVLWDLKTNRREYLELFSPDLYGSSFMGESADHKVFAYAEASLGKVPWIWLYDLETGARTARNYDANWWGGEWLTNQLLEFDMRDVHGGVVFYDPSNDTSEVVRPAFEGMLETPVEQLGWLVRYSPDRSRAIYLNDSLGVTFWDVENNKVLWSKMDRFLRDRLSNDMIWNPPQWSPDGSQVAVIAGNRLFRINRDGEAISFGDEVYYPYQEVKDVAWSPDGAYLAVWVGEGVFSDRDNRLLLLDTQTNRAIDFCIVTDKVDWVKWSPDGSKLIAMIMTDDGHGRVINFQYVLLDVREPSLTEVEVDDYIIAWLR